MLRWLFKLILLLILAALAYGLWLLYQDKTPEEKQELREGVARTFKNAGRAVNEAGRRVIKKGQELYEEHRKEDESE
ncbi:MAG: hypothetical protein RAO92_04260 [Candidatus Euphemobacter frigidus]|nr:hypothetical protein [Candidatus Euphemobacter frigidus]MDP8275599.1 hypothetical protein [Candidatus Euphemobacter frigidus]